MTVLKKVLSFLKSIGKPVLWVLVALLFVVLAIVGIRSLKLDKAFFSIFPDRKEGVKAIGVANSVPKGRVDAQGRVIPVGSPDEKGMTQAVVVPVEAPGIFGDQTKVRVTPPGASEPVDVQLPTGVEAKNVETVIIIEPKVIAVTVKDGSGVSRESVDSLLKRYKK